MRTQQKTQSIKTFYRIIFNVLIISIVFQIQNNLYAQNCNHKLLYIDESTSGANDAKAAVFCSDSTDRFELYNPSTITIWSTGDTGQIIQNLTSGQYIATTNHPVCGVFIDTVNILVGTKDYDVHALGIFDYIELLQDPVQEYHTKEILDFHFPWMILTRNSNDTVYSKISYGDGEQSTITYNSYVNGLYNHDGWGTDTYDGMYFSLEAHTYPNQGNYDVSLELKLNSTIIYTSSDIGEINITDTICSLVRDYTHISDTIAGWYYVCNVVDSSVQSWILLDNFLQSSYGSGINHGDTDCVSQFYNDSLKYLIAETNNYGCFDKNFEINALLPISSLVWPGDADDDGIAFISDIFPIGIGYGEVGPLRVGATNNWIGQTADNWSQNFSGGVNYKHADCNGDGIINDDDTLAILLNYGLTHSKGSSMLEATTTDPELYYDNTIDTTMINTPLSIPIYFGTSSVPANDVYGIAFTVTFDPTLVDTATVNATFNTSWLGVEGTDMMTIQKRFGALGELHVGMVRTNQINVSNYGQIANLNIVTTDDLSGKANTYKTLSLGFKDVQVISLDETQIPVYIGTQDVVIGDVVAGISNNPSKISNVELYPNPATQEVFVNSSENIQCIKVYTLTSQLVLNKVVHNNEPLNIEELNKGMYLIHVETTFGTSIHRLVKN